MPFLAAHSWALVTARSGLSGSSTAPARAAASAAFCRSRRWLYSSPMSTDMATKPSSTAIAKTARTRPWPRSFRFAVFLHTGATSSLKTHIGRGRENECRSYGIAADEGDYARQGRDEVIAVVHVNHHRFAGVALGVGDCHAQLRQGGDSHHGDQREDQTILGQRLTVLPLEAGDEPKQSLTNPGKHA